MTSETDASLKTMQPLLRDILNTTCNAGPSVDLYPGGLCLEDVPAVFDDTSEWVQNTDAYLGSHHEEWTCELTHIWIGGLKLDRNQIISMTSQVEVEAIEERRAGELEA